MESHDVDRWYHDGATWRIATKPSTLLTSIYHVLADGRVFRKMGKGAFGLAAAPATRQRAPRKRRKAAEKTGPTKEQKAESFMQPAPTPAKVKAE